MRQDQSTIKISKFNKLGTGFDIHSDSHLSRHYRNKVLGLGTFSLLFAGALAILSVFNTVSAATSSSGAVKLNAEVFSAIAMKIVSPNDVDPNCAEEDGVTYGVANRYATSNGSEGSKQVDTFDGREGQKDEVNENTSCATLTMEPNTYASTYSDVSVYTNSPSGYALSVKAADGISPNLVSTTDSNNYIPAGILAETDETIAGGQNVWSIKGDAGVLDTWTAASSTDQPVRSYDQETSGGSTTKITYGISAGSTPAGKYATILTYTATSFDGSNPAVPSAVVSKTGEAALSTDNLAVPYGETRTLTITPSEGYYLTDLTCSEGYTCSTPDTGSADNPTESSRSKQTISVTNNNTTSNGSISIKLSNLYRISFNKTNISSPSADYIDVPYGESATVTVAPASGYYLSGFSGCPSGWSCTGASTGTSYTGNQTLTITNNNSVNIGTLSFTGTVADPFAGCGTATGSQCTVNGVAYIRLADGHLWTKSSRGSTTWASAASLCPSGTSLPTAQAFGALLSRYGGSKSDVNGRHGYAANPSTLNDATGWAAGGSVVNYWSSTTNENNDNAAYNLLVTNGQAAVSIYYYVTNIAYKSSSYRVVCYRQ